MACKPLIVQLLFNFTSSSCLIGPVENPDINLHGGCSLKYPVDTYWDLAEAGTIMGQYFCNIVARN
jgi:hypothetical protein